MAEVQRYEHTYLLYGMVKRPAGDWVRFEDYDTLRKLCVEMLDTLRGMNDEELRLYGRELPIFTRAQEVLNEPR